MILEPQSFKGYKDAAKKAGPSGGQLKENLKGLRLRPDGFRDVLVQMGFQADGVLRLGPGEEREEGEGEGDEELKGLCSTLRLSLFLVYQIYVWDMKDLTGRLKFTLSRCHLMMPNVYRRLVIQSKRALDHISGHIEAHQDKQIKHKKRERLKEMLIYIYALDVHRMGHDGSD